jgi:hypothetical protein
VVHRIFASAYEPWHRDPHLEPCAENERVHVEHWTHDWQPTPATVIALHGFTMGDPRIDALVLMAQRWFNLGVDVAMVTLPFHGARAACTARFSGEAFGSWHVGALNEAVRQAVHDVSLVATWLRRQSDAPVGVTGLSLGGYVTALLAGLCPDLAFAIPVAPPVHLGVLPSRLYSISRYAREGAPFSPAELEDAYRVHSPLTYPLALPRERALIIAARGDRIVPPEQPYALWRHWRGADIYWFSGSHFAPFRRPAILAAGARHLRKLGILPGGA